MNINETISKKILGYLDGYIDESKTKNKIAKFLTSNEKQDSSIEIMEEILREHKKIQFIECLIRMGRVEYGFREMKPRLRDHVVHALNTFILGVYLNEKYYKLAINPFEWKLSSLLHDIAYPIQIAFEELINPYLYNINKKLNNIIFLDYLIEKLSYNKYWLNLIQDYLWEKCGVKVDIINNYHDMLYPNKICHGMLSSLSVLQFIDLLYEKNIKWDRNDFQNHVIPACAAIFIHNVPTKFFKENKLIIDREKAPLPFLLRLSDSLQEWERPSKEYPGGFSPFQFDVKIQKGSLNYYASLPEELISNIKEHLEPLQGTNIKIIIPKI